MANGLNGGLVQYGDPDVAAYPHCLFPASVGYCKAMLEPRVTAIAQIATDFDNGHRHPLAGAKPRWSRANQPARGRDR